MNSLLLSGGGGGGIHNSQEYRLYGGGKPENSNPFKGTTTSIRNEVTNVSKRLLSIYWSAVRYHFLHDLSFFTAYFSLIKRKALSRRLCRCLQLHTLNYILYLSLLGLLGPLMPRWARLLAGDVFHLFGLGSQNYAWLVTLLAICLPCTGLLLVDNTGSTAVLLYHMLVQSNSGDFVHPLVTSLAVNGNAHFRKYLPISSSYSEEVTSSSGKRSLWKGKKLGGGRSTNQRLEDTTWAQYHRVVAVKLRNSLQVFPFLADLYMLNLLVRFTTELRSLFPDGTHFALIFSLLFLHGIAAHHFANVLYEVLALLGTLGATLGIAYYVFLEQEALLLTGLTRRQKRIFISGQKRRQNLILLSERTLSAFRLYTARSIDYIGDFNRVYGRALAYYYLFSYPCNAVIVVTLLFSSSAFSGWLFVAMAGVGSFYQLVFMFGVHLYSARMTAKLHRPARWLIGAEVVSGLVEMNTDQGQSNVLPLGSRKLKEAGKTWRRFRVGLQLATYIAHFHTDHQYAMTYGKAGNVTFRSFTRSIFYYLKFLLFAVKIYFEY